MKRWPEAHNIPFRPEMLKPEFYSTIKQSKPSPVNKPASSVSIDCISETTQALATAFVWAQDLRRNAVIKRKGKVEKLHKYDISMDFLVENGLLHQEFHFCQSFS